MAKVIGIAKAKSQAQTVYDPTCGSGSLLLKAAHESPHGVTIYGQEMDNATAALAKMNMILHDNPTAEIWQDNTLSSPHWKERDGSLKLHDFVVANVPFSTKAWSNGFNPAEDEFGRFSYGIPPAKNGDYAFLLHVLASLKSTGKGAIILPHGVLFRGNVEADIRRNIVARGYIKGIIGLPANLFYGTGIPGCIIVLDKENASARKGIFMIDASKGFIKDGNKNRLRAQDIHKIVDAFARQFEIDRYSRMVPLAEISDPKNDFNLNLPRYIDSSEPEDLQDIDAHLRGGIPNRDIDDLQSYWQVFPAVRATLFKNAGRPGYTQLKVSVSEIKAAIFGHAEFTAFNQSIIDLFTKWKKANTPHLQGIAIGGRPKALIERLSEDLLETFRHAPLLDPYDLYQHLMDYWAETMQDDVYMIVSDGWREAAKPQPLIEQKDKKSKEKPDFTVGKLKFKAQLIPAQLVIARYFAAEQTAIEKLEAEVAPIEQAMEEMAEENSSEEGLLEAAKNDKDKLTKASIIARLKEIKGDVGATDERKALNDYLALIEKEAAIDGMRKEAQEALVAKVATKYGTLAEDEIKGLVVDDKWLATLAAAIHGEMGRVSQRLTRRIKELAERYEIPIPQMASRVAELEARVNRHLERMGFSS
jgi:type I restriction enzyme M protein